ncbi:hypothetical protein BpHYR1_033991 [Brachionus plicatilis]|uniref:Uncharacterized protein n=1 Tax=Brachionus plicatilis TaxID=10195 RepID=A0A3M7R4U3_BRAPC|nr:hypothetical protein BpHYR1_033991 [Brachionus plicatilis]
MISFIVSTEDMMNIRNLRRIFFSSLKNSFLEVKSLKSTPSPVFKILNTEEKIVKTFMLKLQENSNKWQIYWIRQPKKNVSNVEITLKKYDLILQTFSFLKLNSIERKISRAAPNGIAFFSALFRFSHVLGREGIQSNGVLNCIC